MIDQPESSFQIPAVLQRHLSLVAEAFTRFYRHGGMANAGNMAFLGMLAFFPFLIFLVALSGFIGQTERGQEGIRFILENLPERVSGIVDGPINGILQNTGGEILTLSILFAMWIAASGVEAARYAVVNAYGAEHKKAVWRSRLESMAVVIIAATFILIAMTLLVIGPVVIATLNNFIAIPEMVYSIWAWARFGISPLILFLALYGMYFALSPTSMFPKRFYAPGALVTLLVWTGTASGFSSYLKLARDFDITYGSLAGVLIAQLFFFVVSIGFILGAQINAAYARHHQVALSIDR